ncbi:MAG: GNAT family N-acetyltransferase [Lachnospiraceae bacterium]|nr:GNAT family N-acetyltransferase [Lachnospiraceae bacterium]
MNLEIRKLSVNDGIEFYEMLQEMPADENGFTNSVAGKSYEEYKEWLNRSVQGSEQKEIIDGWKVPQTTFWLLEAGKPMGFGKVRHFLTEKLLEEGGNVGYGIRPSARNRGLGKQLVGLLKEECGKLGIERMLLTIHKDNLPSRQVALANGGRIDRETDERYYIWIDV